MLEHLITKLENQFPRAIPPLEALKQVLETLSYGGWLEHSQVIECFHRIPVHWLPAITKDLDVLFEPVLQTYTKAIDEHIGGYPWAFADDVCERIKVIYSHSPSTSTKVLALRVLMTSAERLGRFASQATFCRYLEEIKVLDLALPVAEMIAEYGKPSLKSFQGYHDQRYHPAIRKALAEVQGVITYDARLR